MIDGERTLLTGDWVPDEDGTPAEKILAAGIPDLLFERFPGRLEWHSPWHAERQLSHLFRGKVDVAEANALLAEHGHDDLRFLDNGAISRPMEGIDGPRTPTTWSPAVPARRRRSPSTCAPAATRRRSASRSATRSRTSTPPRRSGASSCVANGPERDPGLREAIARSPERHGHRGRDGRRRSTRPWSRPWPSAASGRALTSRVAAPPSAPRIRRSTRRSAGARARSGPAAAPAPARRRRAGRPPPPRRSPRRRAAAAARSRSPRQSGSRSRSWAWSSVSTSPGKTVVTETPVPESSCRSASAKPRSAALVAP